MAWISNKYVKNTTTIRWYFSIYHVITSTAKTADGTSIGIGTIVEGEAAHGTETHTHFMFVFRIWCGFLWITLLTYLKLLVNEVLFRLPGIHSCQLKLWRRLLSFDTTRTASKIQLITTIQALDIWTEWHESHRNMYTTTTSFSFILQHRIICLRLWLTVLIALPWVLGE